MRGYRSTRHSQYSAQTLTVGLAHFHFLLRVIYSGGVCTFFFYLFHEREACHRASGGQRAIWGKGISPSSMWILRTELTVIIRHGNERLFRTQEKGVNQWLQGEKFLCLVCLMSPERRLFSSHPSPK